MILTINISKKFSFIFMGLFFIFIGIIYANAQGGFIPSEFGHSWEEIESPEQANRWANWSEITNKPLSATTWVDWEDIGNLPAEWANGDDVGNAQVQIKTCSWNGNCNFNFVPEFAFVYISEWSSFGESYGNSATFIIGQGEIVDICGSSYVNPALCIPFPGLVSLQGNSLSFDNVWALELKIVAYNG